jgi:beta-barrel assembly-enhancing protease
MLKRLSAAAMLLLLAITPALAQKRKEIKEQKPGFNLFSKEQDIQLGRESAAEIEKQVTVVNNPEVVQYLNLLGAKLAKSKRAQDFPYSFKLVADDSINAFALPGGPMYVHTGLIKASETEGQLVGVLAHEMSHVAMRHGTNQASKANLMQIPLALGGAMAGNGMLGQLMQLGIGLGANSVLLKFSRGAETQADYNGALMMSDAGYNPIEMARFFEKLESQVGKQNRLAEWFASHPSPGNRVKNTEELVTLLPKQNYNGESGQFERIKQMVNQMPPPPKRPAQQQQGAPTQVSGAPSQIRPSGRMRDFRNAAVAFRYPDNWEVFGDANGNASTIAPRAGIGQTDHGNVVAYGIMQSYYMPQTQDLQLKRDTDALLQELRKGDPQMKIIQQNDTTIAGQRGLATVMQTKSAFPNEIETDLMITVPRPDGLFYIVFIAPSSEWQTVKPVFEDVVRSIQFANR